MFEWATDEEIAARIAARKEADKNGAGARRRRETEKLQHEMVSELFAKIADEPKS